MMVKRTAVVTALAMMVPMAFAQSRPASTAAAPSASAAASAAPVSAAKKQLVVKVLQIQQPRLEALASQIVLGPASELQQQLRPVVQRAPDNQREQLARDLEAELRKYADDVTPIARDAAKRVAPTSIGLVLEQQMTEDELRQVLAALESPAYKKFISLGGQMERSFAQKIVEETRAQVQPRVQSLEQSIRNRLAAVAPAGGSAAPGSGAPASGTRSTK